MLQAENADLSQYQQVMIGASIRYGHFNSALDKFAQHRAEQLNQMPSAFFAVNLTARKPEKRSPQTNVYTRKFLLTHLGSQNSVWCLLEHYVIRVIDGSIAS